jgi:hypothetical protein
VLKFVVLMIVPAGDWLKLPVNVDGQFAPFTVASPRKLPVCGFELSKSWNITGIAAVRFTMEDWMFGPPVELKNPSSVPYVGSLSGISPVRFSPTIAVVGDGEGDGDGDAEGEVDGDGDGDGECEGDGDGDGEWEGDGDGDGATDGDVCGRGAALYKVV